MRWLQSGVFYPMMRSHGTDVYREFYYYGKAGEPVYDALVSAVKLRYRLLPYIYATSWQVTHNRSSFMRALPMDFPKDPKVSNMNEEYMFGHAILAAPIVHAQYTSEVKRDAKDANEGWNRDTSKASLSSRDITDFTTKKTTRVYLPAGTTWYDFATGKAYEGGSEVQAHHRSFLHPHVCQSRKHPAAWSRCSVCPGEAVGRPHAHGLSRN